MVGARAAGARTPRGAVASCAAGGDL